MKQLCIVAAVMGLCMGTVHAQSADANAGASSSSGSNAGALSGSVAGANGNSVFINNSAAANSSVTSNATSVSTVQGTTTQNINYSGTQTLKNVPGIIVSGPASGPCNGFSGGVGIAGPGFGFGGNFSKVDEDCTARETARVAALIGRMDVANAVLDNMAIVKAAMAAKMLETQRPITPGAGVASIDAQYTDPLVRARVGLPPLK